MDTQEFTKSAEKMLLGFDNIAKELAPHVERVLDMAEQQSKDFERKKNNIEKDIDSGARTTRHRLHL